MSDPYLVLAPRYSSLVGGGAFDTLPVDTNQYTSARLTIWRGRIVSDSPGLPEAAEFTFEESTDLQAWTDCQGVLPSLDPGEDIETQVTFALTKRYLRMRVDLTPSTAKVNYYAFGFLVLPS